MRRTDGRKLHRHALPWLLTFLFLALAVCPAAFLATEPVYADSVTDTIGIYIGYYGWTEDQYVEKATYSWLDLDGLFGGALETHEATYSYHNLYAQNSAGTASRMYHVRGRGIYIRDLLEYAGVDLNSIASISFLTADLMNSRNHVWWSPTKKSLLDTPRYYFPYLTVEEETGELRDYYGGTD
ncbi:MAG: hypothetical protein IKX91_05565, partial [Firmicutes bacterium]|nr:hypothetical protein [Bacillota bacterium]